MNYIAPPVCRFLITTFFLVLSITTISPTAQCTEEIETHQEIVAPIAEVSEVVKIGNNEYIIPFPWTGNRIKAPKFSYSDFRQIPVDHCKNNSKIYILASAHKSLLKMLAAALEEGILLQVESGYRSIGYQKVIFMRKLAAGRKFEDIVRYVAPPGYSQHMLGIAIDFSPSDWRFASTKQYTWLKENGHRYQFEETYSEFNKAQMPWEAWHWSYIGVE